MLADLTPEEVSLILKLRKEKELAKKLAKQRIDILLLAVEYETWLQDNNMQTSFSTFSDNFGKGELYSPQAVYPYIRNMLSELPRNLLSDTNA